MKKEWRWKIGKENGEHILLCQAQGNKYILWMDDEHIKTVYRKVFQQIRGGLDEALNLYGENYHFVVWNGEAPQLYKEAEVYADALSRHNKRYKAETRVLSIISLLFCAACGVLTMCRVNITSLSGPLVFALLYLVIRIVCKAVDNK